MAGSRQNLIRAAAALLITYSFLLVALFYIMAAFHLGAADRAVLTGSTRCGTGVRPWCLWLLDVRAIHRRLLSHQTILGFGPAGTHPRTCCFLYELIWHSVALARVTATPRVTQTTPPTVRKQPCFPLLPIHIS